MTLLLPAPSTILRVLQRYDVWGGVRRTFFLRDDGAFNASTATTPSTSGLRRPKSGKIYDEIARAHRAGVVTSVLEEAM